MRLKAISIFVFFFSSSALLASYLSTPIYDPDLWWHITVGKWILAHRSLPEVDYWNTFAQGKDWTAYSWAAETIFAQTEALFGDYGLLYLKLLIAFVLSSTIMYCLAKSSGDSYWGVLFGIICTAAFCDHFEVRPQTIAWILFTWALYLTQRVDRDGIKSPYALGYFFVFLLWSNIHLSAIIGLMSSLIWLLRHKETGNTRNAFLLLAIGAVGSLFTPNLGREWIVLFNKTSHPFLHIYIKEFEPATLYQPSAGILFLLFAIFLFFAHNRLSELSPYRLVLCVGAFLCALYIQKFIPFSLLITALFISELYYKEIRRGHKNKLIIAQSFLSNQLRVRAVVSLILLPTIFVLLTIKNLQRPLSNPVNNEKLPKLAVDFIIQQKLPFPLANTFDTGGYLFYRFSDNLGAPKHTFPIDGRTNVNDPLVVKNFLSAYRGFPSWRNYLSLVNAQTILWDQKSPLTTILIEADEWCQINFHHPDLQASRYAIFVKRSFLSTRPDLSSNDCLP